MTKEEKFYKALQDVFIGAKIEGTGGFVNLMKIKSNYYRKIEDILKKDIESALKNYPKFRDELFDKLYSFFSRYFTESGSIYFNQTPFHNNVYEKVYTDEKDVILFWKTQMLYYVKTDRIFRSLPIEFPSDRGVSEGRGVLKFYFDASTIENKKSNEKRSIVFELDKIREDNTIVFSVSYSERGTKTKQDEILKAIKRKGIAITEEQLERAFRVFEKQSEVDFFINKNAKAFLQEQFKLWSYQYFWEGAKEWGADRVNELQILKDIAFKIIDFIGQFEDELVKIWNKPKFVKNSNYVITLDRITPEIVNKIVKHKNFGEQVKEWQELGIVDENFNIDNVFENSPSVKGWQAKPGGVVQWNELPFNADLKERAKELRKAGNLSEVLLWNQIKNKQFLGLDFDRQKIIGNYIVDFYCKNLGIVIEIDGISHDGKIEYDRQRDDYFRRFGLEVIHILNSDVKNNIQEVMEFLKQKLKHPVPLGHPSTRGENTPSFGHPSIRGENTPSFGHPSIRGENTPSFGHPSIRGEFRHLPIDTKYFKDLESEILSQFDDLDKSLDGWLIKSENYQALNTILPKFKEKVQTIYIDPPFNTGKDFDYVDRFQDSSWLSLMNDRLEKARDLLDKRGSLFLHLDYNANSYGRLILNRIFGAENFRNEIIWAYRRWTSQANQFQNSHDYLLWVTKNDKYLWNQLFDKYADEGSHYTEEDEQGKYRWQYLRGKKYKLYLKEGSRMKDWWENLPYINSMAIERTGFETQKPESLIQRIIECSSNKDDIIFDFFLGSGTTTAVAHKLGRKWLGVEMGEHFYSVVLPRMKKVLFYDPSGISKELKTPRPSDTPLQEGKTPCPSDTPLQEGNTPCPSDTPLSEGNNSPSVKGWQAKPGGVVYEGGGFFKYYELEQYEEALANCKYEDGDLFSSPFVKGWHSEGMTGYFKSPYQEYVFMKDEKMLKALEIDYEKEKVKVDLSKLYPSIDIAETLSNLTGKWVKKITPCPSDTPLQEGNTPCPSDTPLSEGNTPRPSDTPLPEGNTPRPSDTPLQEGKTPCPSGTPLSEGNGEVEFEDGTKINTKDLDYKLIKPLIWWE